MKIKVKISMMDSCEELLPTKAHADDAAFVVQEYDLLRTGAHIVKGFGSSLSDQAAGMVIEILFAVGSNLTGFGRVHAGSACQVGVIPGNTLAKGVITIGIAAGTHRYGTAEQPGQLAPGPTGIHAIVLCGAAHRVVGDGGTVKAGQLVIGVAKGGSCGRTCIYILPSFLPAVKKKPPRPSWSGWQNSNKLWEFALFYTC